MLLHHLYIIHSAYTEALKLAAEYNCESIAFPLISSGIYGYPKDEALSVATAASSDFLTEHDMDVYLCVFDRAAFEVSRELLGEVSSYIDQHYVEEHKPMRRRLLDVEQEALSDAVLMSTTNAPPRPCEPTHKAGIDELVGNLDEPFSATLLRIVLYEYKADRKAENAKRFLTGFSGWLHADG